MKLRLGCVAIVFVSLVLSMTAQTTSGNAVATTAAATTAQVPRLVRFSGTATDVGGNAASRVVGVTFSLYTEQTGGAPLWSEVQNVRVDRSGHYTVMLGSSKPDGLPLELFTGAQAQWLGVRVEAQAEQPRVMLLSVPYALKAADAETFGGKPPSAFMPSSGSEANSAANNLGLKRGVKNEHPIQLGLRGSGIASYLPLWTNASTLASAVIYQTTSNNVGIGTTTPAAKLDVNGGVNSGVFGETASSNGTGVSGMANATTGQVYGVSGSTNSTTNFAAGVSGYEGASTGLVFGVVGGTSSSGNGARGVFGFVSSTTGQGVYGVGGNSSSSGQGSAGVQGYEGATTGQVYGVIGNTSSSGQGAAGVTGYDSATTGVVYGVSGSTNSTTDGATGVSGFEGATSGRVSGVAGSTNSNTTLATGVSGYAGATTGVVYGIIGTADSTSGTGVAANARATSGNTVGVYGSDASLGGTAGFFNNSAGGYILIGSAGTVTKFFVDGQGNGFYAGNLNVTGTLTKGGGSFKIDDPLDPENKYLSHSFVESPDMMNIYNGSARLNARGEVWVTMPDYFDALNRDFQYVLTALGRPQPYLYIAMKMKGNRFKIAGGKPNAEVSWQVTGIRQDAWANAHRIPVEEDKTEKERGTYLHPELFGVSGDKGLNARLQH